MEASQAGTAQSGNGDAGGQAAESAQTQQYATADQFAALESGQAELMQFLKSQQESQQQTGQQEQEAEPGIDLSFFENEGYDPSVGDQLAEVLSGHLNPMAQQMTAMQQRVEAAEKAAQDIQFQREADLIAAEIPDLQDETVLKQTLDLCQQRIEQGGYSPEMIHNPHFWRDTYLINKAASQANSEGSEQSSAAHLEGGGGATPASAQVDRAQQIVDASRGGRSALPF